MSPKEDLAKEPGKDAKLKTNFYFNKEGAVIQKITGPPSL
jgi:hypothetical protein